VFRLTVRPGSSTPSPGAKGRRPDPRVRRRDKIEFSKKTNLALWTAAWVVSLLAHPLTSTAQTRPPAHSAAKTKSTPPALWQSCSPGTALRLNAPKISQGNLLQLDVKSDSPLIGLKGQAAAREVPFWPSNTSTATTKTAPYLYHSVIGIDLQQNPGSYEVSIEATPAAGAPLTCQAEFQVTDGHYKVESLKVAPKFVEPSPEDLKLAQEQGARLRAMFATATPEKLWQGKFRMPIPGATSFKNFGSRRVLNGEPSSPHSGVDVGAVAGTPIHATQRGRVVLAEPFYFSGNTVVLDHGLGIYTLYGHMQSMSVTVGDTVEAFQVIGLVGSTGRVTGPHLHWGLSISGAKVNALDLLSLR
jgi:murein DD-endopeptidase MepM/ murein hydrolase activator NlpD